jgi:preprotein translocase subunit SecY
MVMFSKMFCYCADKKINFLGACFHGIICLLHNLAGTLFRSPSAESLSLKTLEQQASP